MTEVEKVEYLRIALGLQKITVSSEIADRIIETYEAILKNKGDFNLKDAVDIELKMDRKYSEKKLKEEK